MTTQSKLDNLTQLITELHAVRQQLAQVRRDLDRLEAAHARNRPPSTLASNQSHPYWTASAILALSGKTTVTLGADRLY